MIPGISRDPSSQSLLRMTMHWSLQSQSLLGMMKRLSLSSQVVDGSFELVSAFLVVGEPITARAPGAE